MRLKKIFVLVHLLSAFSFCSYAQDAAVLIQKVKVKLNQVNDYEASGTMKTNVSFLKVPEAQVKIYYKTPDKLRIKNDKGISLVPKGAVSISFNNLLKGNFTVIDGGNEMISGKKIRMVKLLPIDDNSEMVLSTLYIDESKLLVLKAKINTKENGAYEVEMEYGKYESYALPDKVVFTFNPKDYKLPKGITFDYDDGSKKKTETSNNTVKGKVEIVYSSYAINKGVSDAVFN
jgi:outer membrane lipoprotein-sorting protein